MCRQCNIVETNSKVDEMTIDQIRATAKNLKKIGAGIVLLTGGEPFLRRDLPEIVEAFTRVGLNVRLQTAGTKTATREMLKACHEAGARDINVSIDSLDTLTSDFINGTPGSGLRAFQTIERISSVFRNKSAILSFGTVLSRLNYKEIPAIVELARRIGWFVSLVPVHITTTDSPRGFRSFDTRFTFQKSMHPILDLLSKDLVELKKSNSNLFDSVTFLKSAIHFLKGEPPLWRYKGVCDSPNLYFAIRPNGEFTTCCDYTLKNPPLLYDSNFPTYYEKGLIQGRDDVLKIVNECEGCHYGSYPEVTLSVRDKRALLERILLVMKMGSGKLKDAEVKDNFLDEVESVKMRFPKIYPATQWLCEDITNILNKWSNPEDRKFILDEDRARRIKEGRIRTKQAFAM